MTKRSKKPAASRSAKRGRKGAAGRGGKERGRKKTRFLEDTVGDAIVRIRYDGPRLTPNFLKEDAIRLDLMSARGNLSYARRYLETGQAINYVCLDISWALHSAMKAWLRRRFGQWPPWGADLASLWRLFREIASEDLGQRMSSAGSAVHALETELIGPPPDWEFGGTTWRPAGWTMEGWKEKVLRELERATVLVDEIERYATRKRRKASKGRKPASQPRS